MRALSGLSGPATTPPGQHLHECRRECSLKEMKPTKRSTGGAQPRGPNPPRTPSPTPPLKELGPWYDNGPNAVVALRVLDGEVECLLPLDKHSLSLGASRRCDLSFPGSGMSTFHLVFERRQDLLKAHDQDSAHGTFFHGERVKTAELRPGDIITPSPMSFLAMNEVMRENRVIMHDILGTEVTPSLDRFLVQAVRGANHYLLYGDSGSDQERLARAIHDVSQRRMEAVVRIDNPPPEVLAQKEIVMRAKRSTLVLVLSKESAPLPQTFSGLLFAPSYHVRVIAIAPTTEIAQTVLPREVYENMTRTWIRPLATRVGDIPELFDRLLAERQAPFRFHDLAVHNRDALCRHEWARNFDALREVVDQLVLCLRVPNWDSLTLREQGDALGVKKSTLHDWYARYGLKDPLRG